MKSVTIVKVLVVVFAFSRTFVSGAFFCQPVWNMADKVDKVQAPNGTTVSF